MRVRGILVVGKELDAARDHFTQRFRQPLRIRLGVLGCRRGGNPRRIDGRQPSPIEASRVGFHGSTVQLDRLQDRGFRNGNKAALVGVTDHEQVGRDRIAHQGGRELGGVEKFGVARRHGVLDFLFHRPGRELEIGLARELRRHHQRRIDERLGDTLLHLGQRFVTNARQDVAGEDERGLARGDARGIQTFRRIGDAHVRHDGAVFLREPGHVEHAAALALQMRRHAKQGTDGHDPRAADARHQNAVGISGAGDHRLRQIGKVERFGLRWLAQRPAFDGHERRTETLHARVVLVARRLVDRPLAAELRLHRRDRHAVRLHAAIAAAFAHQVVDDDAPGGIRILAPFPAAAFLRCAGLIVEENRDPRDLAHFALHGVHLVAVVNADIAGEMAGWVLVGLVADDDDPLHAFRRHLPRDVGRRQGPVDRLAAGHRHRVVVENLVGDIDIGRDGSADREDPAVVVGAIAEIREDVLLFGERRLSDPRHAFAAHVREFRGAAVHPDRHDVAPDAGRRAAAVGQLGRRVVRAAGAEVGLPHQVDLGLVECRFLGVDPIYPGADLRHHRRMQIEPLDAPRDHPRDHRRGQFGGGRQQPVAVRAHPFAFFIELADHARPYVVAPVVELLFQLVFDDLPLFLDDEDFLDPFGEVAHALRLERPRHRDLVDANAHIGRILLGNAEVIERLPHVRVALARRRDAKARLGRIDDDPVQLIHAAVMQRRVDLVVLHPCFGVEEAVGPADRHAAFRQQEVVGNDDLRPRRIDIHGRRALDRIGDALEADPAARVARHRPAVQPEVQDFLHRRRIEHRDHRRGKLVIRLMRQRRRLGGMIVAGQHQHAAVLRRAGEVCVLEHVAAAIDTRPLAVPHREHAIDLGARMQVDLLRAPDRRGGEVLVQAGLELDVRAV